MESKLLIFDFDGTLADTFSLFLQLFDVAADRYQFRRFDRGNLSSLRGTSMLHILRYHDVPMKKLPSIVKYIRALMERRVNEIFLFPGITEMIHRLSENGAVLGILSFNSCKVIDHVLRPIKTGQFKYIECGISLFNKAARIRRILSLSKIPAADTIFIGDEIRDLEAARKTGLEFGAVGWGYSQVGAMISLGAHHVFLTPEDVSSTMDPSQDRGQQHYPGNPLNSHAEDDVDLRKQILPIYSSSNNSQT